MSTSTIISATILAVDDNPATLYATSHVLRRAGWNVLEAATGTAAIEKVGPDVDLVILDVNLPDIDGFEVCRKIRGNPETSRIPVIHLSATFVTTDAKVYGLDAGGDGYLTHPVEPPVLIATVNAFLRTRRAEMEREKLLASERAARMEAERANQFKDDFLATLSHELRTPLHAIVGWAQLLQMQEVDPEEGRKGLEAIERNAKAQAQMIADLLDVSRITSGKLRLDVQPVDPAGMVEAALSAVQPASTAKDIRLEKVLDPQAGPIIGDPARLQQIIWNLINNAVKFTPKSGKIQVNLRRVDSHIEISIADNGKGIEPALLPTIFDRFKQGDSSSTREHGGLGLGLAIAKQLVEMHGGTISAESEGSGKGATFRVVLPISLAAESHRRTKPDAMSVGTNLLASGDMVDLTGVRVLLVEDDPDSRSLLQRILSSTGAELMDVSNAAIAIDAIDSFKPHVLVSDIGMPGQDGYALIREVRGRGHSFQQLPAVALTAFARAEDRRKALLAGFQVHVSKPVDPHELTAIIATLVGRTG